MKLIHEKNTRRVNSEEKIIIAKNRMEETTEEVRKNQLRK